MPERRECNFCGNVVEPGTGKLYIKKDGTRFTFCSGKCQINHLGLKRVARRVKWTGHYQKGSM